ncbi:putative WD repeat-containing protein [Porphyridium purpureum]|uniref:Putative WD repeat-containing protein n=1 Tax=Porphyridium purpureum TaxID=35688 RepID=A0A5J4YR41_PORPP|nr:putative WD repeat-containing protein [Porphyridium purpureum]|eukprot:POR1491..scf229_5
MTDVPDYPHQAYLDDGGEGNEDEDMLHDNSVDGNSDNDNHDDINDDNDDDDDDNLYDEDFNETLNNDDADDNEDEAVYSEHHVDHAVALELSYLDVARGEDVQGLPWHTLSQTRAEYRSDRIRQYKNHQSILTPNAELDEGNERAAQAIKEKQFYLFHRNTRRVKCDIVHFQLRNLVWATSKHDVYVTYRSRVMHYDALRRIRSLELNLTGTRADSPENTYEAADLRAAGFRSSMASGAAGAGRIPRDIDIDDGERDDEQRQVLLTDTLRALAHRAASDEDYVGLPRDTGLSGSYPGLEFGRTCPQTDELRGRPIQVSTMVARHDLLAAGGFFGEVVVKDLLGGRIVFESRITHDENAITNALEVFRWRTGALRLMACSNDCSVRIFDVPTFKLLNEFKYGWAVNHATLRPGGGKMMCVVGDDMNVLLADADTGAVLERISGHKDFSFASDWHPDGNLFATGNQDCTTRVWDVRHLSAPVRVIKAHLGPMRSVRFSSDGKLLACAEPADFVHIYGVSGGKLDEAQEIDLFGEMAGFSFSPHGESLFVGISDRTYSSLLEYERVGLHCRPCE